MKHIIIEKDVYNFSELSETAQEKAIEKLWDVNIYDDMFDEYFFDFYKEIFAQEYGLDISNKFYFDLDRHQIVPDKIRVDDIKKLFKAAKINLRSNPGRYYKDYGDFFFELNHHYYVTKLRIDNAGDKDISQDDLEDKLNEFINDKISDIVYNMEKEYEYQTSREAIIETIEANEYTFDINGNLD